MENRIQYVKITLYIEIILGIVLSIALPIFMLNIAASAAEPTEINPIFGALLAIFMVGMPLILLPILAIKELGRFPSKGTLFLNYLNTCLVIAFVFFPVALLQLYMFKQLKNSVTVQDA